MSFYPSQPIGWSVSGFSASGTGSAVDLRGSNGNFMVWSSASSNGPSALASATWQLDHSLDLTNWLPFVALVTSSATGGAANSVITASYSAGAYGFIRARVSAVFSAAQTGTASVWIAIVPGRA